MWIVQLSDFHFNSKQDKDLVNKKTEKAIEAISERVRDDSDIIFFICGDVTEQGSKDGYNIATDVFNNIKTRLNDKHLSFYFVPGNHDLCKNSFNDFDCFANKFTPEPFCSFEKEPIIIINNPEFDIVLINSVYHKDNKYGSVELSLCEKLIKQSNKPKIAVVHHTLLSRYNDDCSTIRDGYKFSNILSQNNFQALLHGHTHGYSDILIGKDCSVIGVGPIFKQVPDVNSQFNIIQIVRGKIRLIENYYYRSDIDKFDSKIVYNKKHESHYSGLCASRLQQSLVEEIKENGLINNLFFNVKSSIQNFYIDIENSYRDVIPVAQKWIDKELPINLPYNHSQYFNRDGNDGMKYILEELSKKPTSSRAIIPLINIIDVGTSEDGFLPSLNIVQFGFDDDTRKKLHVTLYLRAIEVKHFLPINLCEVYLLTKEINKTFRAIDHIDITLNSFRAQYKEVFGCHEKAELDVITQARLMNYLNKKDIGKISKMINEKNGLSETVVIDTGIRNLKTCMNEITDTDDKLFFGDEIINEIISLNTEFEKLKFLRKSTSIYTDIQDAEEKLLQSLKKLGKLFEEKESEKTS